MSTDSIQFTIIAALVSALGGTIIYIHSRLTTKVDAMDVKMDEASAQNADDHARVVEGMVRIEQAVKGIDRDVQRHEREIRELRSRDED